MILTRRYNLTPYHSPFEVFFGGDVGGGGGGGGEGGVLPRSVSSDFACSIPATSVACGDGDGEVFSAPSSSSPVSFVGWGGGCSGGSPIEAAAAAAAAASPPNPVSAESGDRPPTA